MSGFWRGRIAGFYVGVSRRRQSAAGPLLMTKLHHAMQVGQVFALFNRCFCGLQNLFRGECRQAVQPELFGEVLVLLRRKRTEKLIVIIQLKQREGLVDGVNQSLFIGLVVSLPSCGR